MSGHEEDGIFSRLNGYRVPLLINGATLLPVIVIGIQIWADVRQLKDERLGAVSAERIAKLEGQIERLDDKLDRNIADLKRVDEDSRRDRETLHQRLERDRR